MVLPHRTKAGPTTEADRPERAGRPSVRRRDRGRLLEQEWRDPWNALDAELDAVDLPAVEESVADSTTEIPAVAAPPPARIRVSPPPPPPAAAVTTLTARDALLRFRRAAVSMALSAGTDESSRADARDGAASLLALAAGGHEEALAAILRADPAASEATWTVACYQIGDLSPSALRDYAEAAPAVLTLAGCETASHVAAELIVTNGDGVRWTALVRSGSDVAYQPLAPATATAATTAGLLAVRHRWEDQLLLWASAPAHGLDPPAAPTVDDAPVAAAAASEQAAVGKVLGQVLETVRHIEQRLPGPGPAAPAGGDIDRRVTALEAASDGLRSMKADLERVGRQAEELEGRLRAAHERLAASDARAALLEARFEQLQVPAAAAAPLERLGRRPKPPGLAVLLARWVAARLTSWSDRRDHRGTPAGGGRRIELVPVEQWHSDWQK